MLYAIAKITKQIFMKARSLFVGIVYFLFAAIMDFLFFYSVCHKSNTVTDEKASNGRNASDCLKKRTEVLYRNQIINPNPPL